MSRDLFCNVDFDFQPLISCLMKAQTSGHGTAQGPLHRCPSQDSPSTSRRSQHADPRWRRQQFATTAIVTFNRDWWEHSFAEQQKKCLNSTAFWSCSRKRQVQNAGTTTDYLLALLEDIVKVHSDSSTSSSSCTWSASYLDRKASPSSWSYLGWRILRRSPQIPSIFSSSCTWSPVTV